MQPELRYRQIHLDFHTGPQIPGVAADFDANEFADTLARAASVRGVGIVPGRLLYLVRLAKAYLSGVPVEEVSPASDGDSALVFPDDALGASPAEVVLAPDEAAAAIEMAGQVWEEE